MHLLITSQAEMEMYSLVGSIQSSTGKGFPGLTFTACCEVGVTIFKTRIVVFLWSYLEIDRVNRP